MCDVNQLASQLLELSKQLATSSKSFRITLRTEGINFSICSQDDNHHGSKREKKSKSPSQKKRDAERRRTYLMKKLEDTNLSAKRTEDTNTTADHGKKVNYFKCELCDFRANCKVALGKHIQKEHSQIPQLDGLKDSSIKELDTSPITCNKCDFTSTKAKGMEDHIQSEHSIRQLKVKKPPETVTSAEERKIKHKKKKHDIDQTCNEKNKASPFICTFCGETFKTELKHHCHTVYCQKRLELS